MIPNWIGWSVFIAAVLLFAYTRFAGKAAPAEVHQLVADGAALVDVRSPGEFSSGHIAGALNIPVDEIARRSSEIGPKDQAVVLYCRSGARSASAAGTLRNQGFTSVYDLGAMSRW